MIRLLAGVALVVPVLVVGLAVVGKAAVDTVVPASLSPFVGLAAAGLGGAWLASVAALLVVRFRLGRLARAAERIASGDLVGSIPGQAVGTTGRLARALEAIAIQLGESYDAATFDRLTGVNNRQALLAELFTEVERANRYNRPFSVAFVDIDHFKQVNDTYGHHAGDIVLRGVAQAIRANLRVSDMIGRYGGEEFLLLLTETSVDDATNLTEKLRILIERQTFTVDRGQAVSVTVSIGIAGGVGRALRLDALVRDADAAMYSAKSLGRNQTYVFAEPDEDARVPRAPISPAGRSHALAVGKAAREAATAALTSVIAPLPHYRGQPSALIAHIAMTIGARLDLPQAEIEKLRIAALLHDLGKVAVPEEILEKPGSLTSEEWRSVVQHPRIGQVILEQATVLRDAVPIVLHHHERYSGHGYPYGLRGNDIPLGARIVAIADAYDAMISDRPYKRAISHEQAVRELQRHAGTQFDPELVDIFCDLYAETPPQVEAHGSQPGLEHLLAIAAAAGDRATDPAPPAVAAGTAGPEPDAAADEAPGYRRQRAGRPRLGETPAGRSPKRRSSPTAARSASSNRADRRTQSEGPAAAAS